MPNAENDAHCSHGVPLVSTLGGPSAYCKECDESFATNPRYYADGLHLPTRVAPPEVPMSNAEKDAPRPPFVRYERTRVETRYVAEVTEQNIGQIAALIGTQIDYSKGEPELIVPSKNSPWRVKIGWHVSLLGTSLQNQNGFNRDGDWRVTPSAEGTS